MAEFYNTLQVAMLYPDAEMGPMSEDAFKMCSSIASHFVESFRSPAGDRKGSIVFVDGSEWNPTKFTNSQGAEF